MVSILLIMVIQIMRWHMVQGFGEFYGFNTDCKSLPALKYCQPVHSSGWYERAYCMNCSEGTKYHCCKDYDSPKSPPDCPQDDYDCVKEIYVEGCAKVKYCSKGKEPVLSFIKNQQKTSQPTVYCVNCYNKNRYNEHPNTSSAEFTECSKKYNICTQERHKIECNASDSTYERFCRCDARNRYTPYSHPFDHPPFGCSYDNYECKKTRECPKDQEMLLNYTCGKLCKPGFKRPLHSDDCILEETTISTTKKKDVTISMNVNTTALQNRTAKVTLTDRSTESTSAMTTLVHNSGEMSTVKIVGITVAVVVVVAFVIGIVVCRVFCWKKKLCCTQQPAGREEKMEVVQPFVQQPADIAEERAPLARMEGETDGRSQLLTDEANARAPLARMEGETDGLSQLSTDEANVRVPLARMEGETDSLLGQCDPVSQLSTDEANEVVKFSLDKSRRFMVKYLNPSTVLDSIKHKLNPDEARDIIDEGRNKNNSDMIRMLLDKIIQKGPDLYKEFKDALNKTEQRQCFDELLNYEKEKLQDIENRRNEDEDDEETDF